MAFFIELTNSVHGGEGWDLGEVLWSPVDKAWNNIMNKPQKGDVVFHSIKDKKKNIAHRFWGISIVENPCKIISITPPIPDRWDGYDRYYQIPLKNYKELKEKKSLQGFFDLYEDSLKKIIPQNSFYTEKGKMMKTAQKYLASVSNELFNLMAKYLELDINSIWELNSITGSIVREGEVEELITLDNSGGNKRTETIISRIIRDTNLIRRIKTKYDNRCQICGKKILLTNGKFYSEGHHLRKLGGIHQGPDIEENIIILCPNHHVEFDYGIIAIDADTMRIKHMDTKNEFHDRELAYKRNDLSKQFLSYHLKYIANFWMKK